MPVLTITKNLAGQFLGKNPLIVGVRTTNHLVSAEARPLIHIQFTGNVGVGGSFTLEIPSEGVYETFTAIAANATPGINEFRVPASGQALFNWVQTVLIPDVQANPVFNSFFSIAYHSTTLTFTFFSINVRITKRVTGAFIAHDNLSQTIFNPVTTDADEVRRPNYKLRLDVFVEKGYRNASTWELINTLQLTPDTAGDVEFDIADSVRAFVGADVPLLAQPLYQLAICKRMQKRLWTRAYEYYGDSPQPYFNNTTYLHGFVMKGGVPDALFQTDYNLLTGNDAGKKKFLTWLNEKTVRVNDYEWLYFRYDEDSTFHKVKRVVTFADGTTTTDYIVLTASGSSGFSAVRRGDVLMIATGYTQQELAMVSGLNGNKTIRAYSFVLVNSSNVEICEAFTYHVEYRYNNDFRKTFVFQNGWGACETLHVTQAVERTLSVDKELAEVVTPPDFDYSLPATLDVNVEAGKTFKVNTGTYSEAYILHLEELLRSHGFTGIIEDGKIKPVVIVPGSFDMGKEDEDLFSLSFSYRYAHRESNYGRGDVIEDYFE